MTRASKLPLPFLLTVAFSAGMQVAMWVAVLPLALDPARLADFVPIFQAARLLWSGNGPSIYRVTIFSHLPFEAAIVSPLAPLGYVRAYLAYLLVNVLLFGLALRKLRLRGIWAFAACAFVPVGFGMVTGQDSIWTLFFVCAAAAQLVAGGEFAAGAWLGLTMYKPQIGIPICALMSLWRRWRFVAGFLLTASAWVLASIATVGWRTFVSYLALLRSMDSRWDTALFNMVGVRGLLSFSLSGRALLLASAVSSVALLAYAFAKGRRIQPQYQFALAIVACCLVSQHLLAYDLAILLVPLAMVRNSEDADIRWTSLAVFGIASLLRLMPQALMAVPVLAFLFAFAGKTTKVVDDGSGQPFFRGFACPERGRTAPLGIYFEEVSRTNHISRGLCASQTKAFLPPSRSIPTAEQPQIIE